MTERDGVQNRRRAERRVASSAVPATARIRVLVIEDNRLMRDGLARLLSANSEVDVVAAVEGANAGLQQIRDTKPQVVLLDAALANGDSHKFLTDLKAMAPTVKAIMMDFVPAQQDVHQFIEGGANGFIMKDATADDIVKAIRSVASGTDLPPPNVPRQSPSDGAHAGMAGAQSGGGAAGGGGAVRLTKREQEIKDLIAAGLGNKEIAQRLNIATNTVKSHVHNMLGKLAALTPPDRRTGARSNRRASSRRSYRFLR
jgi:DNA-binding NarL/FixJ family response regulator